MQPVRGVAIIAALFLFLALPASASNNTTVPPPPPFVFVDPANATPHPNGDPAFVVLKAYDYSSAAGITVTPPNGKVAVNTAAGQLQVTDIKRNDSDRAVSADSVAAGEDYAWDVELRMTPVNFQFIENLGFIGYLPADAPINHFAFLLPEGMLVQAGFTPTTLRVVVVGPGLFSEWASFPAGTDLFLRVERSGLNLTFQLFPNASREAPLLSTTFPLSASAGYPFFSHYSGFGERTTAATGLTGFTDNLRFLAPAALRTVSGAVRDPAGGPIAGATVRINATPEQTATTGADGKFDFQVAPGSYEVSVLDQGFVVASQAADATAADTVVDFTVARVSGTVVSIDGPPLLSATVLFDSRTVFAGPGGAYSVLVLPALHNLSGCAAGFECQGKHANTTTRNSGVDFYLVPAGKITHRVAYLPAERPPDASSPPDATIEVLEGKADNVSRYFWQQSFHQVAISYTFPMGKWVAVDKLPRDFGSIQSSTSACFAYVRHSFESASVDISSYQGAMVIHTQDSPDDPAVTCASGQKEATVPIRAPPTPGGRNIYATWAHELGHALLSFEDYYGQPGPGDLAAWDLMGTGNIQNPPSPISSFLKNLKGWVTTRGLDPVETSVRMLHQYAFGEAVPVTSVANNFPLSTAFGPFTELWFEGRSPAEERILPPDISLGQSATHILGDQSGIEVYRHVGLSVLRGLFKFGDFIKAEPNTDLLLNGSSNITTVTLFPGGQPYVEPFLGKSFQAVQRNGSFFVRQQDLARTSITYNYVLLTASLPLPPLPPTQALPSVPLDVDLHAFTPDGKHVGPNYTTGRFENQVPGAEASGSRGLGIEWIGVPSGTVISYVVDPSPLQAWLAAYNANASALGLPFIGPGNVIITANFTPIRYDAQGNRTVSSPASISMNASAPSMLAVPATIEFEPETLNLKSEGKFITVEINITGYDVCQIDPATLRLNGVIPPVRTECDREENQGDRTGHQESEAREGPKFEAKFDRSEVQKMLPPGIATITITGFVEGLPFEGNTTIRVISPPKDD